MKLAPHSQVGTNKVYSITETKSKKSERPRLRKVCPHSVLVKIPKPDDPQAYRCMKCGAKHKAEEITAKPKESA